RRRGTRLPGPPMSRIRLAALATALSTMALLAACDGCRRGTGKGDGGSVTSNSEAGQPSLRLTIVSDLAGALEPCGCQKDMLGGADHFAALVAQGREKAKASAVVTVGPTFFMDEVLKPERTEQDGWKAEA